MRVSDLAPIARRLLPVAGATVAFLMCASDTGASEADLILPNLASQRFIGFDGWTLLFALGVVICTGGLGFGLIQYVQLRNLPVHRAMREISELIYATCQTYLLTQGRFILILEAFIGTIMVVYFKFLIVDAAGHHFSWLKVGVIILFSLIGIAGSYGVAWFGIRVNTFANSRAAFASLRGKPFPIYHTPLEAGMSIGMMLISVELLMMLFILLFVPGDYARSEE